MAEVATRRRWEEGTFREWRMCWNFRRDSMTRSWAEEDMAVVSPPETRTTGSLRR